MSESLAPELGGSEFPLKWLIVLFWILNIEFQSPYPENDPMPWAALRDASPVSVEFCISIATSLY